MIREFLATDVESIDHEVASTAWEKTRRCRRCGVRGVFFLRILRKRQADDFRFGKFLAAFVFAETVAAAAHAGCLNGEDKVVVILAVEEWHKALLAGKTLVDEKIFLVVPHGIAEIDRLDSPAVAFKLVHHHPSEVLFVDGIVRAESGSQCSVSDTMPYSN